MSMMKAQPTPWKHQKEALHISSPRTPSLIMRLVTRTMCAHHQQVWPGIVVQSPSDGFSVPMLCCGINNMTQDSWK
eukprot:4887219-Amphidinium_carterae.1